MDGFTRITRQGWTGRLGGAIKGLIGGVVLLLIALGLQFWNEGRTHRRDATLADGRSNVTSVSAATPSDSHQGRLVHVTGHASAPVPVSDEVFAVNVPALALRRRVEMYQWQEKRDRKEEKQIGGGTRTVTTYRYESRWDDEAIDSDQFEQPATHRNPGALPYENQSWRAREVRLGGFSLTPAVASEIGGWKRLSPDEVVLPPNLAATFRAADGWFITGAESHKPAIGDVRVRFEYVPEDLVSVIARQQDGALHPSIDSDGDELLLVETGERSAAAMLDAAAQVNAQAGWALRFAGFVLAWIGFGLLMKPLVVLADVVPLFGRLAGVGVAVTSAVLAAAVSLLAIASGWLWNRPWTLGLGLLAIVLVVVWLLRKQRTGALLPPVTISSNRAVVAPPPPPPPPAPG